MKKPRLVADDLRVSTFETTPRTATSPVRDVSIVGCTHDETCQTRCRICFPDENETY